MICVERTARGACKVPTPRRGKLAGDPVEILEQMGHDPIALQAELRTTHLRYVWLARFVRHDSPTLAMNPINPVTSIDFEAALDYQLLAIDVYNRVADRLDHERFQQLLGDYLVAHLLVGERSPFEAYASHLYQLSYDALKGRAEWWLRELCEPQATWGRSLVSYRLVGNVGAMVRDQARGWLPQLEPRKDRHYSLQSLRQTTQAYLTDLLSLKWTPVGVQSTAPRGTSATEAWLHPPTKLALRPLPSAVPRSARAR